jgi:hypothetical protein
VQSSVSTLNTHFHLSPPLTRSLALSPLHPCDTRPTHSFVCASPLRLLQPFFLRSSRLPRAKRDS